MSFRRFLLVRLGWGLFALWLGLTLVFLVLYASPRAPGFTRLIAGGPGAPPEAVERTRTRLGYDDPIAQRYVDFLGRQVGIGTAGRSVSTGEDARELALGALPATLSLLGAALIVWLGLGIGGGLLAVRWNRRWAGRPLLYFVVGLSPVWLGLWLSYLVVYKLEWLGAGYCEFFDPPAGQCGGAGDWVRGLVLPGLVLGSFFGAIYARMIARIVRFAGESRRRKSLVIGRLLGRDVGYAIGAAALVELIFGIPGLGRLTLRAIETWPEVRVAEAALILAVVIAVLWHFLVDVVVAWLDQRLRTEWPVAAIGGRA